VAGTNSDNCGSGGGGGGTPWVKKQNTILAHNFPNCWPVFKFFD